MTGEFTVLGISRLDDHVLLADAGLGMGMVAAGAQRLVDLRGETSPPRLPVPIDHFPIMDLEPAGLSRTSTVAIAYLMLGGMSLRAACDRVRAVRPQALPALELWHSLEGIEVRLSAAERAEEAS